MRISFSTLTLIATVCQDKKANKAFDEMLNLTVWGDDDCVKPACYFYKDEFHPGLIWENKR